MSKLAFIKQYTDRFFKHRVAAYSAQTAFFMLLSIFPFMILLISLIQFLNIPREGLAIVLEDLVPSFLQGNSMELIDEFYSHSFGTISFSMIVTLWSAAKTLHAMRNGLDSVNEVEEIKPWLAIRIRAMMQTFCFIVLLGLILIFIMFGSYVVELLEQLYLEHGGTPLAISVLMFFRFGIVFVLLSMFITYAYAKLSNKHTKFRVQFPAAVTCAIAWVLLTVGFAICIRIFDFYSIYGTLSTVISGLIWAYLVMNVFFGCAELSEEIRSFWGVRRTRRKEQKEIDIKSPSETPEVDEINENQD